MATYPTGTYAPASKANGQVIQASFFNDPDAEIVAVEDALRNGIPHAITISTGGLTVSTGSVNIAGPSSLTTLQVNGASTFSTLVTFAAPVTLSSGATVSSGVIRQNSLPMWSVYRSTHVALAAGDSNGIAFDVQDFVRGSVAHSTTTNSSRVTIGTTGIYRLSATALIQPSAAGNPAVKVHIRQNDSSNLISAAATPLAAAGIRETVGISHDVRIDSTCYLTCVVVSSGFGSTVGSSSPHYAVRFSGHFVG